MVRRGSPVRVRKRALQKRRTAAVSRSGRLAPVPTCGRYGAVYGASSLRSRSLFHRTCRSAGTTSATRSDRSRTTTLGRRGWGIPIRMPHPLQFACSQSAGLHKPKASVPGRVEAVRPVPVPEVRGRVVRDDDAGLETAELSRPARERQNAGESRKRERDMAECAVSGPGIKNEVAVETGGARWLRVDDLRADVDGLQVGRRDRAEGAGLAVVLRALLGRVKSSTPGRRRGEAGGRNDPAGGDRQHERQGALHDRSPCRDQLPVHRASPFTLFRPP